MSQMAGRKDIWDKFHKALKSSEWREARTILDTIIDTEPDNPNHFLKRGDICQKMGDRTEAVASYLKAAFYLKLQGFLKKALAIYKMVLRIDPGNRDAEEASKNILEELTAPKPLPAPAGGNPPEPAGVTEPAETAPEGLIERTSYEAEGEASEEAPPLVKEEDEQETTVDAGGNAFIEPTAYTDREGGTTESGKPPVEPTGHSVAPEVDREDGFLSPFTNGEINEILSRAEIKKFGAGEVIVREGDTGDTVYIIRQGRVTVRAHILGRELDLADLAEGDLFGEVAYLTGRPRTADVIAESDVEVYEISRALLDEIIERRPEIMSQVNEIYNARVRDTITKAKSK